MYADETTVGSQAQQYIPDLIKYLPTYYSDSKIMNDMQSSISEEIGLLKCNNGDLLNQFFVNKATWGLSLWENKLGIIVDLNKSYENRREIIKAKLRGSGTVTKELIMDTAQAFSGGDVNIIEHSESYSFIIQFVGIRGIPKSMEDFEQMLEMIKPAHLAYSFKFTYTVWDFIDSKLNWQSANTRSWNDLKVYQ